MSPSSTAICGYGTAKGHLSPVNIGAFQIVNGSLLMQYGSTVQDAFNKDLRGNLETADKTWPTLNPRGE